MRIAKLLANYNQGSRREIERLIAKKKVFLNKKVVLSPITFVDTKDEITINNKKVTFSKKNVLLKFYKPKNIICSKKKQDERKIIYEVINKKYQNFIFVGRLDFNSEGLILLTNSSDISRNLELPKNNFEREYEVRVYGDFNVEKFCNILLELKKETKTKFLIITHHKTTMTSIDRVYGVTMAQKGISDIVSVDFEKIDLQEAV